MSDGPSDYVGWDEYLGLNTAAGDAMTGRAGGDAEKGLEDMDRLMLRTGELAHHDWKMPAGGSYEKLDAKARAGLASYGEFMNGMNDPASRQALMEKTYGKGAVSWLDSEMAGANRGAFTAGQEKHKRLSGTMDVRDKGIAQNQTDAARRNAENAAKQEVIFQHNRDQIKAEEEKRAALQAEEDGWVKINKAYNDGGLPWERTDRRNTTRHGGLNPKTRKPYTAKEYAEQVGLTSALDGSKPKGLF